MIAVIISLIVIIVPSVAVFLFGNWGERDFNSFMNALLAGFVLGLIMAVLFLPLAHVTGGFMPNYSEGTREGYITKVSVKGAIWKTNEAQIQVGTGEMAALQEPFSFSISDPNIAEAVKSYLGDRVRITYKQWLIQPAWYGETTYDCISIVPINDTVAPWTGPAEQD
jgi:hypothetical protein